MKTILIQFFFALSIVSLSFAQDNDTIYHNESIPMKFKFLLADTTVTAFKVSKIDIIAVEGDTIKNTINTDTFFVKRIINGNDLVYDYWLAKRNWTNIIVGSNCSTFHNRVNRIPKFKLKWNEESQSFQIDNCEENISVLEETLKIYIDCIMEREDQSMLEYALEDIEDIKDCERQTSMMLQDLGHVASYINFPIPDQDSLIKFSIISKTDTTGLLNIHFNCEKEIDSSSTTIRLSEDLTRSEGVMNQMQSGFYNAFKHRLTPQERKRDSIRQLSMESIELTTISVDNNMLFQNYKRYTYFSKLNIDLKRKKSEYWHIVEKIKD